MRHDYSITVRSQLEGPTFVALESYGKARGKTVGEVLAELADHAVSQLTAAGAMAKPEARHHGPKSKLSQAQNDRLIALHAQGWSDVRIGKEIGVDRGVVTRRRDRLGLKPNYQGRPRKDRAA